MINYSVNLEILIVTAFVILFIYLLSVIVANTYVTMGPAQIGRLSIFSFLMGMLVAWVVIGNMLYIEITMIFEIIYGIYLFTKALKTRKNKQKISATRTGGNN